MHLGKDPKIAKKDGMVASCKAASTENLEMIPGPSSNGNENNIEKFKRKKTWGTNAISKSHSNKIERICIRLHAFS